MLETIYFSEQTFFSQQLTACYWLEKAGKHIC